MKRIFRKLLKLLGFILLICLVILGIGYVYLASQEGGKAAEKDVFKNNKKSLLVFAHRGGAGLFPENTISAFQHSLEIGVDVLELDIHSTSDGKLVVLHDPTVERTTNGSGKISEITLSDVKKLDAGFNFSPDKGQTFPFRGKNITIPTLEEVFDAFPSAIFNIEPKQAKPSIIKPFCDLLRQRSMTARVIVGSFRQGITDEFRKECPEVATSASPSEVAGFLIYQKAGLTDSYLPPMQALQVPRRAGVQIVTKDFVDKTKRLNLQVHVWTINETTDMQRLIDLGVDGIMTDYPDRLLELLNRSADLKKSD